MSDDAGRFPSKGAGKRAQFLGAAHEAWQELVDTGKLSKAHEKASKASFTLGTRLFDLRFCRGSIFTENLFGLAKHINTSQYHLSITEIASADWLWSKVKLNP